MLYHLGMFDKISKIAVSASIEIIEEHVHDYRLIFDLICVRTVMFLSRGTSGFLIYDIFIFIYMINI